VSNENQHAMCPIALLMVIEQLASCKPDYRWLTIKSSFYYCLSAFVR